MRIAEEMKELMQDILSSYGTSISTVSIIVNDTYRVIEDSKNETKTICEQLRGNLANGKSLRKKDFDNMMKDVFIYQEDKERELMDLLKTFFKEQKNMAETVKEGLSKDDERDRLYIFKKILQDFKTREGWREDKIILKLKEFHRGYKEIDESLRSLLDKGMDIQIRDFKKMLEKIRERGRFYFLQKRVQVSEKIEPCPIVEKGGDRAIEKEVVVMV